MTKHQILLVALSLSLFATFYHTAPVNASECSPESFETSSCSAEKFYGYCPAQDERYALELQEKESNQIQEKKRLAKLKQEKQVASAVQVRRSEAPVPAPIKVPPVQTPAPTPASSPSPELAPPEATPKAAPETPPTPSSFLNSDLLFQMVNNYRAQKGLAPFEKHAELCSLAQSRAPELHAEINVNRNMHAGLRRRMSSLAYRVTENIISNRTEQGAFNWWLNSRAHHNQILGNFKYSCTACQGNQCAQVFSNM